MKTMKIIGKTSRLSGSVPVFCMVAVLSLLFATGCDNKTSEKTETITAAPAAGSAAAPPGAVAPGNPNPSAAANAAAFEAARKKAEGK